MSHLGGGGGTELRQPHIGLKPCVVWYGWVEQKKAFADAIEDEYYFEMFIDDLPMYGYIGEVRTTACLLPDSGRAHTAAR